MAKILPHHGIVQNDCVVSILIIGPAELCDKINEGLHQSAKARNWHISVHQCEIVTQITELNFILGVDFIIFAFDWRITQSVSEVETNIGLIDEYYIISGAACLVNCKGISNVMGLSCHTSTKIQEKYNIRLLCANIFKPDGSVQLANRILNLIESIFGVTSGVPVNGLVIH